MHGSSAHHYQDLMPVPLSKEDVFTNRSITLADKRRFMKFLSTMRPDNSSAQPMDTAPSSVSDNSNDVHENAAKEPTETINCTLREALDKACLTEGPLGDMIIYSIAHQPHAADMPWDCAKQRIEQFIRSVGRYGKSPFLLAHYGAAELCQAFCRLSAVFGGVYMLNHSIASVNSRDDENGKPRLEVTLTSAAAEATVETVDYVFDAASSASLADNVRCQLPVTKKTARGILITTAEPAELCTTPCLIVLTPPSANERLGTIFWLRVGADTCHAAEGFCKLSYYSFV
jgi:RAB protein geranylgeranyltransferase component A